MFNRKKNALDEMQDVPLLEIPFDKVKNKKIESVKISSLGVENDLCLYAVTVNYDDGSKVRREMDAIDIVATLWRYLDAQDKERFKKSDLQHDVYADVVQSSSKNSHRMFKPLEGEEIHQGDAIEQTTKPKCCVIL